MISGELLNWRRLVRSACALSVCCALVFGYWWLKDPDTLPISLVRVEGNLQYLDKTLLEESIAPHVTGGFFNIDVSKVQSVLSAMPWIGQVVVQRVWPDSLKVTVTERRPIARWGENNLVDRQGILLSIPKHFQKSQLPVLYGPKSQMNNVIEHWLQMNEALRGLKLQIKWLSLSERHAWDAELTNGMLLRLGKDEAYARLERFIDVYPLVKAQQNQPIRYADLRYTNGMAIGT